MAIKSKSRTRAATQGFALLIAVIFMAVMLSLGVALSSLGYKQVVLASTATESEYAFYAADAGLECVLYADQQQHYFDAPNGSLSFSCNGVSNPVATSTPATPRTYPGYAISCPYEAGYVVSCSMFNLGANRCVQVTAYKPNPTGSGTTYLYSNGYDVPCATVTGAPGNGARFVERGLQAHY